MYFQVEGIQQLKKQYNLSKNKTTQEQIEQLQIIHKQTSLLYQIKDQIKQKCSHQQIQSTSISLELGDRIDTYRSIMSNRTQYSWKIDEGEIQEVLLQVKRNCSELTYEILQKLCQFRLFKHPNVKKCIERQLRMNKTLKYKLLKLQQQNYSLKNQISQISHKLSDFQKKQDKIMKKQNQLFQKEKKLIDLQLVLLRKQQTLRIWQNKNEKHYNLIIMERNNVEQSKQSIEEIFNNFLDFNEKNNFKDIQNNIKLWYRQKQIVIIDQQRVIRQYFNQINMLINQLKAAANTQTHDI